MSINVVRRKGLISLIAMLCLLPIRHPGTVVSGASQGSGCGPSQQGVDRLRADLGLDNSLANRANSLASSALRNGQAPPPTETQALTEDSLDGLNDAGDQLDQATSEISKQLDSMDLPRQQRVWSKGVSDLKTARTTLRSALRQDPIARGQRIGSLSPTGVGPTTVYEAAANYQNAADNFGSIIGSDQGGWMDIAKGQGRVGVGSADTNPPPNPGPDPWQEWLKRLQAQMARIRNSVNGLNAAQALRAGQFQQAQQNAGEMQKAMQSVQNLANQLGQMASLCNQAANQNQRPPQNNPSTQPQGGQGGGTGTSTVAKAGGNGAKMLVGGTLAVAGVAAAAVVLSACKEPSMSDATGCGNGNCSACVAMIEKLVPYCDCLEQKHPNEAGGLSATCRDSLAEMRSIRSFYRCEPAVNFTPIPVR